MISWLIEYQGYFIYPFFGIILPYLWLTMPNPMWFRVPKGYKIKGQFGRLPSQKGLDYAVESKQRLRSREEIK